jgi:hypothetical protein
MMKPKLGGRRQAIVLFRALFNTIAVPSLMMPYTKHLENEAPLDN